MRIIRHLLGDSDRLLRICLYKLFPNCQTLRSTLKYEKSLNLQWFLKFFKLLYCYSISGLHFLPTTPPPPPSQPNMMCILASRILCCGSNRQIHMDYRTPVERKGRHGHSLSEREGQRARESPREPNPCQDRLLLLFWASHQGWFSFTMRRFTVGDYLLQTTKRTEGW